jgi:GDP-L-fucose synthase
VKKNSKIFVPGAGTLIGSAIVRQLKHEGYCNLLTEEIDFADAKAVDDYFSRTKPDYVFVAAGNSGGIGANQRCPADLMRDNLLVACHIIYSAYCYGATKLLYLASSCCYPKLCPQPMQVGALFTGPLERTNEAYALAKLSGIELCRAYRSQYGVNFISAIPANAFGPGDDFSLEDSHVVAALIRKIHEAKAQSLSVVRVWGTGAPRREFIYADDLANGCIFLMLHYDAGEPINLGTERDFSIKELAGLIKEIIGYTGEIQFDCSKPDGMPAKRLDSSRLRELGWKPKTDFRAALEQTYQWFKTAPCQS